MNGGAGNNTFVFGDGSGQDTINSFNPAAGKDKLDVSSRLTPVKITAANFTARVTITAAGADTLITFVGTTDTIRLVGVARANVSVANFILAP
jgi:hypothetical protein